MSIINIPSNPTIVSELITLFGDASSGVFSLTSPDNNLLTNVVAQVGQISLQSSIQVSKDVSMGRNLIVAKEIDVCGGSGSTGQLLSSGGTGEQTKWVTPSVNLVTTTSIPTTSTVQTGGTGTVVYTIVPPAASYLVTSQVAVSADTVALSLTENKILYAGTVIAQATAMNCSASITTAVAIFDANGTDTLAVTGNGYGGDYYIVGDLQSNTVVRLAKWGIQTS